MKISVPTPNIKIAAAMANNLAEAPDGKPSRHRYTPYPIASATLNMRAWAPVLAISA